MTVRTEQSVAILYYVVRLYLGNVHLNLARSHMDFLIWLEIDDLAVPGQVVE